MTDPKQPDDHPSNEQMPALPPNAPNGVPPEAVDVEPKGHPTSDRQATETAASPDKHKP